MSSCALGGRQCANSARELKVGAHVWFNVYNIVIYALKMEIFIMMQQEVYLSPLTPMLGDCVYKPNNGGQQNHCMVNCSK